MKFINVHEPVMVWNISMICKLNVPVALITSLWITLFSYFILALFYSSSFLYYLQIVAEYFGSIGSMVFRNDTSIHWPLDRGPPENIPDCGFKGDNPHCKVKGLVMICHQLVRKTAVFFSCWLKYCTWEKTQMTN